MPNAPKRPLKGQNLWAFPEDYIVVDIETGGLCPSTCDIIEISALKYRHDEQVDRFISFLKPTRPLDPFIIDLTGITNEMLADAPAPKDVLAAFHAFAENEILIGHNVHFDVNFLYDKLLIYNDLPLTNAFVDTLRLSRKALPFLPSHRQDMIAAYFGISSDGAHRAERDCDICHENYVRLKKILNP